MGYPVENPSTNPLAFDAMGKALGVGYVQNGNVMSKLKSAQQDINILVIGDSTGNETTEWVYLLLQKIAVDFPAWTIKWQVFIDGSPGAYDPVVTIQTGTGPRTLMVYNCSVPGQGYDYLDQNPSRAAVVVATEPDLTIISYGYNSNFTTYRGYILHVVKLVQNFYPRSEFMLVAQPPKGAANSDAANHILRSMSVRKLATDEGFGLIDALQAFLDYGNYSADLIQGDTIHPNPAGSAIWANEAYKSFRGGRSAYAPSHRAKNNVLFVGPGSFFLQTGSPAIVNIDGRPAWAFDDTANEVVSGYVSIPTDWNAVEVYMYWWTAASSGNVAWIPRWARLGNDYSGHMSGQGAPAFTAADATFNIAVAPNTARFTRIFRPEGTPSQGPRIHTGRPLAFQLTRDASNAVDTAVGDAYFGGLSIERWD